jgi:hypothetical protein
MKNEEEEKEKKKAQKKKQILQHDELATAQNNSAK